jgi:hypothetical protein
MASDFTVAWQKNEHFAAQPLKIKIKRGKCGCVYGFAFAGGLLGFDLIVFWSALVSADPDLRFSF